jgi:hypothetical protein
MLVEQLEGKQGREITTKEKNSCEKNLTLRGYKRGRQSSRPFCEESFQGTTTTTIRYLDLLAGTRATNDGRQMAAMNQQLSNPLSGYCGLVRKVDTEFGESCGDVVQLSFCFHLTSVQISKSHTRVATTCLRSFNSHNHMASAKKSIYLCPRRLLYAAWTLSATICLPEHCFMSDPGRSLGT